MELQNTLNGQSNLVNEEQSLKYQAPWLQSVIQCYTNQNRMVLEQKQTQRSMKQGNIDHLAFLRTEAEKDGSLTKEITSRQDCWKEPVWVPLVYQHFGHQLDKP